MHLSGVTSAFTRILRAMAQERSRAPPPPTPPPPPPPKKTACDYRNAWRPCEKRASNAGRARCNNQPQRDPSLRFVPMRPVPIRDLRDRSQHPAPEQAPGLPKRRDHIPLGILHMVGRRTIVFSASSASSKWLVATYPVGEVLVHPRTRWSRSPPWRCSSCGRPGLAVFRTGRLRHHVMRSFSQFCSQSFLIIAFSLMPRWRARSRSISRHLYSPRVGLDHHAQGERSG